MQYLKGTPLYSLKLMNIICAILKIQNAHLHNNFFKFPMRLLTINQLAISDCTLLFPAGTQRQTVCLVKQCCHNN